MKNWMPDDDQGSVTASPIRKNSLVPSATGIRRAAMDRLARREYSRHEIEQKLCRRFPDATAAIGPVLDQLEHEGLLSDSRFTEIFMRSRISRGHGPERIVAALRARGIIEPVPALQAVPINWLEQARETRTRKFGEALPADMTERARQMRFLARRGFAADICHQACLPPRDE